ncbi:MAG: sensor domain-containing diguanylate cyclase [Deltaproteobacteria bacterium]|nr:sensor domain-containing diguanylate cyclase [Deltaproteobacteria bacterium]
MPLKTFITLTVLIGLVEYGLMYFLGATPVDQHAFAVGTLDSLLLILILFPFLYLLVYKPFNKNIQNLTLAKESAEESHDRLLAVLDSIDAIVYVADMQTHELLFVNKFAREIFGDIRGEICWQTLQAGQSGPCSFCTNDKLVDAAGLPLTCRWEFRNTIDGRWYDIRDRAVRWIDGNLVRLEVATDITERRKSEEKIKQQNIFLQNVIESLPYPFYVVDTATYEIVLANSMALLQGISKGRKCYAATHNQDEPCDAEQHQCPLNIVKRLREPVIEEHVHKDLDGNDEYVEMHGYPIADEKGRVAQMIEYQINITERKKNEETLRRMSVTDVMTGLYNRRGFLMLAEKQIKIADRLPGELFVLYADCDKLKWLNDTLGHKFGDELIMETADLLRTTFRQADIIGRLGGDEFVVLMVDESGKESIGSVQERLASAIVRRNELPDRRYVLSLSFGIVQYDKNNPCSMEQLLSKADHLMYKVKKKQRENEP